MTDDKLREANLTHDEYPSEANLERIKYLASNPTRQNIFLLLDLIEELWWMPEQGFATEETSEGITLHLSTLGWSGNEDIMAALYSTLAENPGSFYQRFWQMDKRGGHFEFFIPKEAI